MESPLLAGVRSKIERSHQHFDEIHTRISTVLGAKERQDHVPNYEYDSERQILIVRQPKFEPIDPALALIVGDCIHNMRSALDHLVFQLAVLNGASPIAAERTSFPVFLLKKKFDDFVRSKLAKFITPAMLAEIEQCQPYNASDPPDEAVLWVLSQLDIIDKHRLLVVVSENFRPCEFEVVVPTGEKFANSIPQSNWKPMEPGAEILRFDLSSAIHAPGKVHVHVKTATTVQFANTAPFCDGMAVEDILAACGRLVEFMVEEFGTKFFGE